VPEAPYHAMSVARCATHCKQICDMRGRGPTAGGGRRHHRAMGGICTVSPDLCVPGFRVPRGGKYVLCPLISDFGVPGFRKTSFANALRRPEAIPLSLPPSALATSP
jgi:hypothetical protein